MNIVKIENFSSIEDIRLHIERNYPDLPQNYRHRVLHEIKEFAYTENKLGISIIDKIKSGSTPNKKVLLWYLCGLIDDDPTRKHYEYIETEAHAPDIDVDCLDIKRPEIISELSKEYGNDNLAIISAFNTLDIKNTLQDIFRIFNVPHDISVSITKNVNIDDWEKDLRLNHFPRIKGYLDKAHARLKEQGLSFGMMEDTIITFINLVRGQRRQSTEHAAGILLSDNSVFDYLPIRVDKKNAKHSLLTEYDLEGVEGCNFLKIDLLSLRTLSVMQDTVNLIKKYENVDVDLFSIDFADENLFKTIEHGNMDNVFQLGTESGKQMSAIIKPKCFDDIVAITSLNRPGTKIMVDDYVSETAKTIHPCIDSVVEKTHNIIMFQEQLNQIISGFLDIDEGAADLMRRDLEKANTDEARKQKIYDKFFSRAQQLGKKPSEVESVFAVLFGSAGYLFNKSHAVAYSIITMQTLWLKTYYPLYFYAASLKNPSKAGSGKQDTLNEMKKNGINLEFPDVNYSDFSEFVPNKKNNSIFYNLSMIKGFSDDSAQIIQELRPYKTFYEFLFKLSKYKRKINAAKIEILIKIDALRKFCVNSKVLLKTYEEIQISSKKKNFTLDENIVNYMLAMNSDVEDFTKYEKLIFKEEYLDIVENVIPLAFSLEEMKKFETSGVRIDFSNHEMITFDEQFTLIFEILESREVLTKKDNKEMAILTIRDFYDNQNTLTIFPREYEKVKQKIVRRKTMVASVKGNVFNDRISFVYVGNLKTALG